MGIFNAAVGFVTGLIMGFISGIIGFFTFLYHALVGGSIIPDLVNGIIDWIAQLPGRAMAFIGSLVSSVIGGLATMVSQGVALAINFVGGIIGQIGQVAGRAGAAMNSARDTILSILGGIASSAFNAGASIVKGIADGITAAIHWVTDAISNVTNWISAHLPHSPAKVGPLRFLAEQGESITAQISEGMLRGLPRLHGALGDLIEPLSMNVNGAALSTNAPIVPSQFYQAAQPRIIINLPDIVLDGHRLTRAQMPYIAREIKDGVGMWGM
jgi:phage-related protein